MTLSPPEARAMLEAKRTMAIRATYKQVTDRYEFIRPFGMAAEDLLDWMVDSGERLEFGLPALDSRLRGVGRGELCFITGKAHSGKTQLLLHLLCNVAERRILYFTPDETDTTVLCKLLAIQRGMDVGRLERKLREQDVLTHNLVRRVAAEFPNLILIDQPLTFPEMERALHEAEEHWGDRCQGVFVDYLDLLPGDGDYTGTKSKAIALKRWTKTFDVPVVAVHQPRRGGARRGQEIGMDDMHMGGETEGTFVLGVYRKRDDEYLEAEDRAAHMNTISVNISKNKRPPCHKGVFDFHLDEDTGSIRELQRGDLQGPVRLRSVSEAQQWRRG
jgi:replicative DNA helicase